MNEVFTRRHVCGAAAVVVAAAIFGPPLDRDYETRQADKEYIVAGQTGAEPSAQPFRTADTGTPAVPAVQPLAQAGHREWLAGYSGNMTDVGKAAWLAATGSPAQVLLNFYDQQAFASVDGEIGMYGNEGWYMPSGSPGSNALSVFTMGLVPGSGSAGGGELAHAAAGDNDADWMTIGQKLADAGMNAWSTIIRLGHEMNASYYPWGIVPQGSGQVEPLLAAQYKDGWKRAVAAMRKAAPKIRFELCMNGGGVAMQPDVIYPGDDHVDIIGFDGYGQTAYAQPPNFESVIPYVDAHKKKFAISEWGPGSGSQGADDPTAVQQMYDGLIAADAAYPGIVSHDCYYDQGSWQLLPGQGQPGLPHTAAKIRELWHV